MAEEMTMTDLRALRERVAGLQGPDRGVDGLIARDLLGWLPYFDLDGDRLLDWHQAAGHWHLPGDPCDGRHSVDDERNPDPDEFTASIDAAVALIERVLPGCVGDVDFGHAHADQPGARLFVPSEIGNHAAEAPTPALALLLALLDAKISEEPSRG
jgi:hypothetical protein